MKVEAKQNLGLLPVRAVSFSFHLLEWQGLLRGKRIKTGDVSPGLLRYRIPEHALPTATLFWNIRLK